VKSNSQGGRRWLVNWLQDSERLVKKLSRADEIVIRFGPGCCSGLENDRILLAKSAEGDAREIGYSDWINPV
jgi:hypothetical protein